MSNKEFADFIIELLDAHEDDASYTDKAFINDVRILALIFQIHNA